MTPNSFICYFIKICISLLFLGLILTTLAHTSQMMSVQDIYVAYIALGLSMATLSGIVVFKSRIIITLIDVVVIFLLIITVLNYLFISDVSSPLYAIKVALMAILYINLRCVISFFPEIIKVIIIGLFVVGALEAFIAIQQALGYEYSNNANFKVSGTFFNPGPLSGYLSIVGAVAICYVIIKYNTLKIILSKPLSNVFRSNVRILWMGLYIVAIISICLIIIVLPATLSRTGFLAICIAVFVCCWTNKRLFPSYKKYFNSRYLAIITVLVLAFGVALYALKTDSANGRILIWYISILMITDNPVCGIGIGAFRGEYTKYQGQYFEGNPTSVFVNVADSPEYGFNEYLQYGAETGVIGLLLLITLFTIATYNLVKHNKVIGYGLIAFMVFAFASYPFSILPLLILFIIFIASGASASKKITSLPFYLNALLTIGGTFIMIFVCQYSIRKLEILNDYKSASVLYQMEVYDAVVEDYLPLYLDMRYSPDFMFEYGRALNKMQCYKKSNEVLSEGIKLCGDPMFYNIMGQNYKELGNIDSAILCYNTALNMVPNRLYPRYLLMQLYSTSENYTMAYKTALEVVNFQEKIVSPATLEMKDSAQKIIKSIKDATDNSKDN